jgi:TPR repeat protein
MKYLFILTLMIASLLAGEYEKGVAAYNQGNFEEAARLYTLSADQGNADAQLRLGLMYEIGFGIKQDYKEAARLYTLSANQGNSDGQLHLGLMYVMGQGIKLDKTAAYHWWSKAAKQGNTKAQDYVDKLCKTASWACK